MRWHNYISLILLAAVAFSGCQNNLIDVNPPVAGSVNSYAWKAMGQLEYISEDSSKNAVKLLLQFSGDSLSNQRSITESINGNTFSTLSLYSKFDTMAISRLTPYSVIPVPSNYSLSRTGSKVVDGPMRRMKHIVALADKGAFIASDDSSNIYFINESL